MGLADHRARMLAAYRQNVDAKARAQTARPAPGPKAASTTDSDRFAKLEERVTRLEAAVKALDERVAVLEGEQSASAQALLNLNRRLAALEPRPRLAWEIW